MSYTADVWIVFAAASGFGVRAVVVEEQSPEPVDRGSGRRSGSRR